MALVMTIASLLDNQPIFETTIPAPAAMQTIPVMIVSPLEEDGLFEFV